LVGQVVFIAYGPGQKKVSMTSLFFAQNLTCVAQAGKEKKETKGPTAKTQAVKAKSAITSKFVGTWKLVAIEGQLAPNSLQTIHRISPQKLMAKLTELVLRCATVERCRSA
jgi:hypothetical protein